MKTRYLFGLPFIQINVNTLVIEALIDTGFNGALLLPEKTIKELKLKRIGQAQYTTADGLVADSEIFVAEIEWFDTHKTVSVVSSSSDISLAGMELLYDTKTTLYPAKNILIMEICD